MITAFECSQCGSTEFVELKVRQARCAHCGSLFQVITNEPVVVINKGANVVFGKNARVEIRGDLEVQDGANVEILGKVTILEGKEQKEFKLKLIRGSSGK
jgi:DNA-directed RNA polymerase subunit RPC12/RpoP